MDGVAKLCFEGSLNLISSGNLASGGALEEGSKKGVFLGQREILVAPTTFARSVESSGSEAIVGGDDNTHQRNGDATVEGDGIGEARFHKSVIDNGPASALGLIGSRKHSGFDGLDWKVGSSTCYPAHIGSRHQAQPDS